LLLKAGRSRLPIRSRGQRHYPVLSLSKHGRIHSPFDKLRAEGICFYQG
jgi:hypothetical protein